jgi:hypothetical protein
MVSLGSTGLIRREALERLDGFDTSLSSSEDRDFLLRLITSGTVEALDQPLALYRVHEGNMSKDVERMEPNLRRLFAKLGPQVFRGRQPRDWRKARASLEWMLAGSYLDAGEARHGIRLLVRSLRIDPPGGIARSLHALRRRAGARSRTAQRADGRG